MKPITTIIHNNSHYMLKLSIMHSKALSAKAKYQVYESTVLKGFIFSIKRGKTIKIEEML